MTETVENSVAALKSGLGQTLAQLRAERKLSIADVAQRLKYGARQIEALEAEEFDRLPGATFVRGMVRGYAKLLETDPEPILGALDQSYAPEEVDLDLRDKGVPFAKSGKRGTWTYSVLLLLVLVVLAGVLYEWRVGASPWARFASPAPPPPQKQAQPQPAPAVPREEPQPPATPANAAAPPAPAVAAEISAPPSPQPSAGGEGRIRLEFAGESWVEIKDGDGKMLMSQLNPSGSRRVLSGRSPLSLVIGNAANVRLIYNDKPVDLKPYIQIEVAKLTLD